MSTNKNTPSSDAVSAPRRSLLRGLSLGTLAGGSGLSLVLNGCGGGSSSGPEHFSTETAATAAGVSEMAVATGTEVVVQARKVQWVAGRNPSAINAWVYVQSTQAASTAVLPSHMGPTFNYRRAEAAKITWRNDLPANPSNPKVLAEPPTSPPLTLDICGNVQTQSDVGTVIHMHGARVAPGSDGWPLTPLGFKGNPYGFAVSQQFTYPNQQRGAMLWYHDHALDRTGKHVHAGLCGVYFIRDAADDLILSAIGGAAQEMLCVMQDRHLSADGLSIDFSKGIPTEAGFERPEFLGSEIFVNGRPSPSTSLTRRTFRLRLLNASNARTYALALVDLDALNARTGRLWYSDCLRVIGADGGLVSRSVLLASKESLVIAPGQRRDVLIDLSKLPAAVKNLRLVNIALMPEQGVLAEPGPVGIFSDYASTVFVPSSDRYTSADADLYAWLNGTQADSKLAKVLTLSVTGGAIAAVTTSPTAAAIDRVLAAYANDDDFVWNGTALTPKAGAVFGANRLVLLTGNTAGREVNDAPNNVSNWSDVQIMEMAGGTPTATDPSWPFQFNIDLNTKTNPAAGSVMSPTAPRQYKMARKTFFSKVTNPDITATKVYPAIHAPTIIAKAGTYERWYVANIGNNLPLVANPAEPPDMHPFHIHLVSSVVTRRWVMDTNGNFVAKTSPAVDLDRTARQDTVRIESNELVEILVYYPPGFVGDYVYHCHLLEHEDMCMMSHFKVIA